MNRSLNETSRFVFMKNRGPPRICAKKSAGLPWTSLEPASHVLFKIKQVEIDLDYPLRFTGTIVPQFYWVSLGTTLVVNWSSSTAGGTRQGCWPVIHRLNRSSPFGKWMKSQIGCQASSPPICWWCLAFVWLPTFLPCSTRWAISGGCAESWAHRCPIVHDKTASRCTKRWAHRPLCLDKAERCWSPEPVA